MNSFLEFVCQRLMGHPAFRSGGSPYWSCPRHEDAHASFHIRPVKAGLKNRFSCWSCGWWGDVADLVKEFYPGEDWPRRRVRLERWRRDFESEQPETDDTRLLSPGMGTTQRSMNHHVCLKRKLRDSAYVPEEDEFFSEADAAISEFLSYAGEPLVPAWRKKMLLVQHALEICAQHNLHSAAFAARVGFEEWKVDSDQRHLAECTDSDCDAIVCRSSRGLPPLTKEEIEAGRREIEDEARQQRERIRRMIKKRPVNGRRRQ